MSSSYQDYLDYRKNKDILNQRAAAEAKQKEIDRQKAATDFNKFKSYEGSPTDLNSPNKVLRQQVQQNEKQDIVSTLKANPILAAITTAMTGLERGSTYGTGQLVRNNTAQDKMIQEAAKEQFNPSQSWIPSLQTVGEVVGMAPGIVTGAFGKLFGSAASKVVPSAVTQTASKFIPKLGSEMATAPFSSAVEGISGIISPISQKIVPSAIKKAIAPVMENAITKSAIGAGRQMAEYSAISSAADIKGRGDNITNNLGEIAKNTVIGAAGGAVLGGGLGAVGAANKAIKNVGGAFDDIMGGYKPSIEPSGIRPITDFQNAASDITAGFNKQLALPASKAETKLGQVMNKYNTPSDGQINIHPETPQAQLPTGNRLALNSGAIELPPARPTNLNESIQSEYIRQIEQSKTQNVLQRNNLLEQPNKVYPGELATPSTSPPKFNPNFARDTFQPNKIVQKEVLPVKSKNTPISSEQKFKLDSLEQNHFDSINNLKNDKVMDPIFRSKQIMSENMRYAAKKRELIQGNSLISVKNGLTPKELNTKIGRLESNYKGKEVITPDGDAIATGQRSFGNVGVKNADGVIKYYPPESITPKLDVAAEIKNQQAKLQVVEPPVIEQPTPNDINSNSVENKPLESKIEPINHEPIPNEPVKIDESLPNQNESAVKNNTMVNKIPEYQTPEGQKFAKEFDATYGVKTDADSISKANKMLTDDYNGTYERFIKDGIKSKEENIAAWQITRDLLKGGEFEEANKLISSIRPDVTNAAQIVQSMSTVAKDSLEGVVIRGKQLIESFNKELKNWNPEQFSKMTSQIKKDIKNIGSVIDKNYKLLDINLQQFATTVDKELKKIMGKMYKKSYVDSIVKLAESGKYSKESLTNAVRERYGVPEFNTSDIEKMSKLYAHAKTLDKSTYEYAKTMQQIDNITKDKLPRTLATKVGTYQYINLFLNTITASKILSGNITSTTMVHMKDILTAIADNSISLARGKGITSAFPDALTKLKGMNKRRIEVGLDRKNEVNTSIFDLSYDFDNKLGLTFKNKFWRGSEKWMNYMLSVMEAPFKQGIYDDELRMMMKVANVAEPTEKMLIESMGKAQKVMFANTNDATQFAADTRSKINNITNKGINRVLDSKILQKINADKLKIKDTKRFGVGNLIQPIIRTPINMAAMAFDYSPLSILTAKTQKQLAEGIAKNIIGTVFGVGAGYVGKKTGYLSGGTLRDADGRNYAEDAGRQPYSWNVGGKSVDVSYIQPLGMLQSFGAELATSNSKKAPFVAALDSLVNQGILQGFAKLFGQSSTFTGSFSENVLDAVSGGASTMIPFSSLQNQVSKSLDTVKRDTSDDSILTRNLANKTLGRTVFRTQLPAKISNQGQPMKEDDLLNTWLMPGKVKDVKNDPTTKEIMRLYDESNETKQFPPKPNNKITYKDTRTAKSKIRELNDEELTKFKIKLGIANSKAIDELLKTNKYKYTNNQTNNDKQKADLISAEMTKIKQKIETEFLKTLGINEYKAKTKKK